MKQILKIFLIVISTSLLFSNEIEVNSPIIGSEDISIDPTMTLKIKNGYEIVPDNFTIDSTIDEITYDTNNNKYNKGLFTLFNSDISDGNDSNFAIATASGAEMYGVVIDSVTFELNPRLYLDEGTNFSLKIDDFRVYNPNTLDTILLDTVINDVFQTAFPDPELSNSNVFSGNSLNCKSNIVMVLNSPIDTAFPGGNPIFTLDSLTIGTDSLNKPIIANTSSLSGTTTLDPTGKIITFNPDNDLDPEVQYKANFNLSEYTGDPNDDNSKIFNIPKFTKLSLSSIANDTSKVLPPNCEMEMEGEDLYVEAGQEVRLKAQKIGSGFEFSHWFCPENPMLLSPMSDTLSEVTFTVNCEEFMDMNIHAVYEEIPIDTVEITDFVDSEGIVIGSWEISNYLDSLNDSTYTYYRYGVDTTVSICAIPDSAKGFGIWKSSDDYFGGNTSACLSVTKSNILPHGPDSGVRRKLHPEGGELGPCTHHDMYITIKTLNLEEMPGDLTTEVIDYLKLNGGSMTATGSDKNEAHYNATNLNSGQTHVLELDLKSCYEIVSYKKTNSGRVGSESPYNAVGNSVYIPVLFNSLMPNCNVNIDIVLRPKVNYLEVERVVERGGSKLPPVTFMDIDHYDDTDTKIKKSDYQIGEPTYEYNIDGDIVKSTTIYGYGCNDDIRLQPIIYKENTGYSFSEWIDESVTSDPADSYLTIGSVVTPVDPDKPDYHEFDLSDHKKCRYSWEEGFRWTHIEYPSEEVSGGSPVWKKINSLNIGASQNSLAELTKDITDKYPTEHCRTNVKTTEFKIYFSEKVNINTVRNGNIYVSDNDFRADGTFALRRDGQEATAYESNVSNTLGLSGSPATGYDGISFEVRDAYNLGSAHFNTLNIGISGDIENMNGTKLENPDWNDDGNGNVLPSPNIKLNTVGPGIILRLHKFKVTDNSEGWLLGPNGEFYIKMLAALKNWKDTDPSKITVTPQNIEAVFDEVEQNDWGGADNEMEEGDVHNFTDAGSPCISTTALLIDNQRLTKQTDVYGGVITLEDDDTKWIGELGHFTFNTLGTLMKLDIFNPFSLTSKQNKDLGDFLKEMAVEIRDSKHLDNDDDMLDDYGIYLNEVNNWGIEDGNYYEWKEVKYVGKYNELTFYIMLY